MIMTIVHRAELGIGHGMLVRSQGRGGGVGGGMGTMRAKPSRGDGKHALICKLLLSFWQVANDDHILNA